MYMNEFIMYMNEYIFECIKYWRYGGYGEKIILDGFVKSDRNNFKKRWMTVRVTEFQRSLVYSRGNTPGERIQSNPETKSMHAKVEKKI